MKYDFNFDFYGNKYKGTFTFNDNADTVYDKINEYSKSKNVYFLRKTRDSDAIFKYIQDKLYIDLCIVLDLDEETVDTIEVVFR